MSVNPIPHFEHTQLHRWLENAKRGTEAKQALSAVLIYTQSLEAENEHLRAELRKYKREVRFANKGLRRMQRAAGEAIMAYNDALNRAVEVSDGLRRRL